MKFVFMKRFIVVGFSVFWGTTTFGRAYMILAAGPFSLSFNLPQRKMTEPKKRAPRKRDRERAEKQILEAAKASDFAEAADMFTELADSPDMTLMQRNLSRLGAAVLRDRARGAEMVESL